jgi:hypothetical protein
MKASHQAALTTRSERLFTAHLSLLLGASFHFHAQYYVPSSEVAAGITPRAGITLSMAASDPAGQGTYLQPLNRNYYSNPGVEPPEGEIVHPVSPDITPDTWVTFEFD